MTTYGDTTSSHHAGLSFLEPRAACGLVETGVFSSTLPVGVARGRPLPCGRGSPTRSTIPKYALVLAEWLASRPADHGANRGGRDGVPNKRDRTIAAERHRPAGVEGIDLAVIAAIDDAAAALPGQAV